MQLDALFVLDIVKVIESFGILVIIVLADDAVKEEALGGAQVEVTELLLLLDHFHGVVVITKVNHHALHHAHLCK